eukprot:Sspe_Gene.12689::Locus_4336_Transcript_1_1_Confidence_1.000_Length_8781::g.12689::m.12689
MLLLPPVLLQGIKLPLGMGVEVLNRTRPRLRLLSEEPAEERATNTREPVDDVLPDFIDRLTDPLDPLHQQLPDEVTHVAQDDPEDLGNLLLHLPEKRQEVDVPRLKLEVEGVVVSQHGEVHPELKLEAGVVVRRGEGQIFDREDIQQSPADSLHNSVERAAEERRKGQAVDRAGDVADDLLQPHVAGGVQLNVPGFDDNPNVELQRPERQCQAGRDPRVARVDQDAGVHSEQTHLPAQLEQPTVLRQRQEEVQRSLLVASPVNLQLPAKPEGLDFERRLDTPRTEVDLEEVDDEGVEDSEPLAGHGDRVALDNPRHAVQFEADVARHVAHSDDSPVHPHRPQQPPETGEARLAVDERSEDAPEVEVLDLRVERHLLHPVDILQLESKISDRLSDL